MNKEDFSAVFEAVQFGYIDSCNTERMVFRFDSDSELIDDSLRIKQLGFKAVSVMKNLTLTVSK